jgi:hypothetical protein
MRGLLTMLLLLLGLRFALLPAENDYPFAD